MPGTGKALGGLLLAAALGAAIPASGGAQQATATSTSLRAFQPEGASAADTVNVFTLTGSPGPSRTHAYIPSSGRLTLTSPEGIGAPSSPPGVCTQDSATQVSCAPGSVIAIAGDLGAGDDFLTTDPALTVAIGIQLSGPDSPLIGGEGNDRVLGAAADDLILGGAGADTLRGNGATDVLRGEAGADKLNGGAAPDALYGGGGDDQLDGAGARDLCVGAAGKDLARSCTVSKSIP